MTEQNDEVQSEELTTAEELDQAYDDAWDELDEDAPEDDEETNTSETDSDDAQEEESDSEDDDSADSDEATDTDADADASEQEEEETAEEAQRRKSWEGRVRAEEQKLKADREKFEQEKKARAQKARELMAENSDETDWDKVAQELEIPELASFGKELQRQKEFNRLQLDQQDANERQASSEAQAEREREKKQQMHAHVNAIRERHPNFQQDVASREFQEWEAAQDPMAQAGIASVKKAGNAAQVNAMLDSFKASVKNKPKPSQKAAAMAGVKRGAAKPRKGVDKNDYDSAWDEFD